MVITFMDIARESLRPIRQALGSARPDAPDSRPDSGEDSRFANLSRNFEARVDDGIGTPIDDFKAAVGRRFDFRI